MVDSTEFGAGLYGNLSKPRKRTIPESVLGMKPFANKETFDVEVDDYNAYFMNQLFELLTEYGEVAEVWFDGAHPKHKGGQQYRKDLWEKLIRKLQPGIIIHGNGFDEMRWVGNEFGFAREAEWNVIPAKWAQTTPWKAADLGSRQLIAKIGETEFLWLPSETDVSIRPGWFYHASQDSQVKQPDHLLKIYLESIGRNSTLLLNIPPDRRGLIHENDVKAIETFHQRLSTALRTDFAAGATKQNNGLNLTLKKPAKFNLIVLQEDVLHTGQRIEKLHVEAQINGKWKEIARAETVGYKRVLKLFEPVTAQKVRVIIDQSRLTPTLSHLSLHYYPENDLYPPVYSAKKGIITLTPPKTVAFRSKRHVLHQPVNTTGYLIRYTTDDTAVTPTSPKYTQPLALQSGTLRVRCYRKNDDGSLGESTEIRIKISYPTEFITEESRAKKVDEALILKLKTPQLLQGFSFHPGTNRKTRCLISNYSLFISTDGKTWNPIRERDTFGNIKNSPTERNRRFSPQKAQWVKFIWHKSENQKFDLPAKQIKLFVK
jgi:alpha-L-fucosidase